MNCPVCRRQPMIILELNDVEIDYCPECCGIWLDAGELELLLGNNEETDKFLSSFVIDTITKEKKIKCPICSKKMEKVLVGEDNNILIDRCRNNDGLWFDKGELEEILKQVSWGKDNKVLNLLKEMFDHNKL